MSRLICLVALFLAVEGLGMEQRVWLEVEQFDQAGGWSNDSQHVDIMGSPYLLAHGLGSPVADAEAGDVRVLWALAAVVGSCCVPGSCEELSINPCFRAGL